MMNFYLIEWNEQCLGRACLCVPSGTHSSHDQGENTIEPDQNQKDSHISRPFSSEEVDELIDDDLDGEPYIPAPSQSVSTHRHPSKTNQNLALRDTPNHQRNHKKGVALALSPAQGNQEAEPSAPGTKHYRHGTCVKCGIPNCTGWRWHVYCKNACLGCGEVGSACPSTHSKGEGNGCLGE